MRFIHIVPERPLATGSGAQIRAHALSRALASRGEVVTLILADALARTGLGPVRAKSFIEAALPEAVLSELLRGVQLTQDDTAIVEGVHLSEVARRLCASGMKVILDAHNVESDLLRQTDTARHPYVAPLLRQGRWRRAKEAEGSILRSVSSVWACSRTDALNMQHLAPAMAPSHVVPNPVPEWCLAARHEPRPDGIAALFVGHLGYRPNIVAAQRLLRNIMPAILQSSPSALLTIAGRAPHASLLRLLTGSPPSIELIAAPSDLTPLYAKATMTLIPLSEGGGTRIKALEAMALGLPVIASAKAVEGLELVPGREFLLAESDAEFADAALRLAGTPALRAEIAVAARDFALHHHGPPAIEAAIAAALSQDVHR